LSRIWKWDELNPSFVNCDFKEKFGKPIDLLLGYSSFGVGTSKIQTSEH
jgi:hypothetical protein